MIPVILESLGLNPKEIQIYLTLLSTGSVPASVLGQRTKISRSTAQYTCQQLVKKGLITSIKKNNTFLYIAEDPEKLLTLLDHQKKVLEQKENQVHQIIGSLKGMMNPHAVLPRVQFYEGKDGMVELYNKVLSFNAPIDSFEEKGELYAFFPEYAEKFVSERIRRGIHSRTIAPSGSPLNVTDPKRLIEARYLDVRKYPLSCDVKICADQVTIFSFAKNAPVGISITHEDIASNFRILFEYVWESLR